MALKGHGDPRWIVEERSDGKNVNNWHWTETDYTAWAKNRLTELLSNLEIETTDIKFKTNSLTCTGDASVNTRKKKTFLFYELVVNIKWEGTLLSTGTTAKGTIDMPYISEENDPEDFEIQFTVEGKSNDDDKIKNIVKAQMVPLLKERIPKMLAELKEVALGQTKLPPKEGPSAKIDKIEQNTSSTSSPSSSTSSTPTSTPTVTKVVSTKASSGPRTVTVNISEKFMCRPIDLYHCFVEINRVRAYAGSDALVDPKVGGKFTLFGGAVTGEFVALEIPSKIVQKWRFSSWAQDLYSNVTFEFEDKSGKTVMKITQTGVPEDDKERTEAGWRDNFCRRVKGVFGYGSI